MKMFFILLIIVVYFHNGHSLNCIGNTSFEILRSELISNKNSFTLKNIRNRTIELSGEHNLCYVKIFIDYNQTDGNVIIHFGLDTNHTVDYFGIETSFPLVKRKDSMTSSSIEHGCLSDDFCDRVFVEKWIHWLMNINYETLQDKLIYLLTSDIYSNKCHVGDQITSCSSGMCIAEYNLNLETNCVDNTSTTTIAQFYVKIQSIELQPMQYEELSYTCMSDGCNNISTFNNVKMQTKIIFDHLKSIMKWFDFRNRFEESNIQRQQRVKNMMEDLSNRHTTTRNNDL